MPFAKGIVSLPSRIGMIFTILLVAVVGVFALATISLFSSSRKATTTAAVFEQFYEYDEIFRAEQGLGIAVGLDGADGRALLSNG